MQTSDLLQTLNTYLKVDEFKDYAPNGLQVQGRENTQKVALAVSASLDAIEQAVAWHADTLIVHHGWFWKGEPAVITGVKYQRLKMCLAHGLNLMAFHLPLDSHKEVGNNAQLAKWLQVRSETIQTYADYGLLWTGTLQTPCTVKTLCERLEGLSSDRKPLILGNSERTITRVGWCSGAGQDFIELAKQVGCDLFLSGEAREPTVYLAQELDITYMACGHYATETLGIQALGRYLRAQYPDLEVQFFGQVNPI